MPKCPKCGFDLPRENPRLGTTILEELMSKIGGPEELARGLADQFKKLKKHPNKAGPLYRLLIEMVQAEDKASLHQNFVEEVAESQERGYVIEYVLSDRTLLQTIVEAARTRGMLPALPAPDVFEAEYERVS
jgi:hypothetical protein